MSNLYNSINVKDLPSLEQILAGNYLIVENVNGTNKLDFADFVIGPLNTSFYTSIANDIRSVSAREIVLSTELDVVSADLSKKISTLNDVVTSTVESFSPANRYFQRSSITLIDRFSGSNTFTNAPDNIDKSGFNVQFGGLLDSNTNIFYPNSGFDLAYNYWINNSNISPNTIILTLSTNGLHPQHARIFYITANYFNVD
jgi:hypothetical protein